MNTKGLVRTYFCSGARNLELLESFTEDSLRFECDERMASFKALGFAKSTLTPTAICTTSGTAVSECLSALIEAYYSCLPLILITGDRPKRMHDKGCPQTIDHEIITRGYRKCYKEVALDELYNIDFSQLELPAHINVLIEKDSEIQQTSVKEYEASWNGFNQFLADHSKPLFLFSHESVSMRPFIDRFKQFDIPFYAEILSQAHDLSGIRFEKDIQLSLRSNEISSIVRIGHTPVSKFWRSLERNPIPQFSFDERKLKGLSFGSCMGLGSRDLIEDQNFWNAITSISNKPLISSTPVDQLQLLIQNFPISDIAVLQKVIDRIPTSSIVYVGNSLVIRFLEIVSDKPLRLFGNRGVNGIDGQLSTAIGIANTTSDTIYCILGDMTSLYDLAAFKDIPMNLKLIIINNGGGRIFETMKLDPRLIMEHQFSFSKVCQGLNLIWKNEFEDNFTNGSVWEFKSDPKQTMLILKEWES